ncbi:hypothetical protein [Corynebacterium sp.]|nr:hypothetical protein [Corynebacterium sp.]
MIATAISLASSAAFIWGILEVFTEYQRAPGAGIPSAARRAASKYGF